MVLYIEDNAANLALVRKVLEHSGYQVVGVPTGEEGVAYAAQHSPDLILLDLDLPGMDGFTAARAIKKIPQCVKIPIIAISASVMKHEREQALEAGCVFFIEKPFDIGQLRAAVDEAIAAPAGLATS